MLSAKAHTERPVVLCKQVSGQSYRLGTERKYMLSAKAHRERPVVLCKQVSGQSYRLGTEHGNACHQPRLRGETYKLYYVKKLLVRATDSVQDTEVRVISRSSD